MQDKPGQDALFETRIRLLHTVNIVALPLVGKNTGGPTVGAGALLTTAYYCSAKRN